MKLGFSVIAALAGAWVLPCLAVEPPLPGEDGLPAPSGDFAPLLQPGDQLPAGAEAPVHADSGHPGGKELFPEAFTPGATPTPAIPGQGSLPLSMRPPGPLPGTYPLPGEPAPPDDPLLPPPAAGAPEIPGFELATRARWHPNPRDARDLAIREKKPLLIFFRQKWKSAPMPALAGGQANAVDLNVALNDDLLSTEEFNQFAAAHLVLTSIRYPIGVVDDEEYPKARLAAMKRFKEHFGVKGFPHIVLIDPSGKVMERVSGYSRIREKGVELSTAQPILERLKLAVSRYESVLATETERMERLTAQNFREWTSRTNSKLFAKFVSRSPEQVVLMEENGTLKKVSPQYLSIVDQAWIDRHLRKRR